MDWVRVMAVVASLIMCGIWVWAKYGQYQRRSEHSPTSSQYQEGTKYIKRWNELAFICTIPWALAVQGSWINMLVTWVATSLLLLLVIEPIIDQFANKDTEGTIPTK